MLQPFYLAKDSRTGQVYRLGADLTRKVAIDGDVVATDAQILLALGHSGEISEVDAPYLHRWLDSIPTAS